MRCTLSRKAFSSILRQESILLSHSPRFSRSAPGASVFLRVNTPWGRQYQSTALGSACPTSDRSYSYPATTSQPKPNDISGLSKDSFNIAATAAPLTPSQLSRAAAQTVRLCFRDNVPADAFYILNSARYSEKVAEYSLKAKIPGTRSPVSSYNPIDFGQTVSARLSAHTMLHCLLRRGHTKKAVRLADLMMKDGIKLRKKTLQAAVASVSPKMSTAPGLMSVLRPKEYPPDHSPVLKGSDVLKLRLKTISDPSTRLAIGLILRARQYRQERSQKMFDMVIDTCLLQGELIASTLLFCVLLKDWELRKTLSQEVAVQAAREAENLSSPQKSKMQSLNYLRSENLYPSPTLLTRILQEIETALGQEPRDSVTDPSFCAALQALANLASALDHGMIPFSHLAPLIRTLYSCPKIQDRVWIRSKDKDNPVSLKAHSYFHYVILRLIHDLPSKRPPRFSRELQQTSLLPPLSLASYNALLHYALRHRLSPALADKILRHMISERQPPLEPDMVTYNILIRSGTLLRRTELADRVIQSIRQQQGNSNHALIVVDPAKAESGARASPDDGTQLVLSGQYSQFLTPSQTEQMSVVSDDLLPNTTFLHADSYTLVAYISYLTSTGQPHVVAEILFQILPQLCIIDHPSWGNLNKRGRRSLRVPSRAECLKRAMALGPHFFSTVLNALRKAGRTGLAERVWLLAKEAERASWSARYPVIPWCLPVHAYTTMMQCYAAQARKVPRLQEGDALPGSPDWSSDPNRAVSGWARFVLAKRNLDLRGNVSNRVIARKLSMLLLEAMGTGARSVCRSLIQMLRIKRRSRLLQKIKIPVPDARFFNVVLDVFCRTSYARGRDPRPRRAYWRRKLRQANVWYAREGTSSRRWDPSLQEISQVLVNTGYPVPGALRYLFVGRWPLGTLQHSSRKELNRQPYAFPRPCHTAFRPYSLQTTRTRGLPIRRNYRTRGRERTKANAV